MHVCVDFLDSSPARVVIAPGNSEFNEGSTIIATCVAYGLPEPSVTWSHDGNQLVNNSPVTIYEELLNEGDVIFVKSAIEICGVEVADSGDYSCLVANDNGTDTVTFNLNILTTGKIEALLMQISPCGT